MMTSSTFSPVACSASALSARSTSADRSSGRYCTPASASFCPVPIRRLNEAALRFGCVTRRSRAVAPTSRLPSASTETADGVSTLPCTLAMGVGTPSFSQAMRLLVVPRSMPKIKGPSRTMGACRPRFAPILGVRAQRPAAAGASRGSRYDRRTSQPGRLCMNQTITRLWLAAAVLVLAGCASSYVVPGPRADLKAFGSPSIQESFAAQPSNPFPATLAFVRVQAPTYKSARLPETLAGAAGGRYRVITTRESEDDSQVDRLGRLPQVTGVTT